MPGVNARKNSGNTTFEVQIRFVSGLFVFWLRFIAGGMKQHIFGC